jgi:hypothetical protein
VVTVFEITCMNTGNRIQKDETEHRGRVVSTPASYSGATRFIISQETGYPNRVFVVFLSPYRRIRDSTLQLEESG